jgi:hypothetical protein
MDHYEVLISIYAISIFPDALGLMHNVGTPKRISDMISSQTNYRTSCKVQLTNTLVHAKAKEMNAGKSNLFNSRYNS